MASEEDVSTAFFVVREDRLLLGRGLWLNDGEPSRHGASSGRKEWLDFHKRAHNVQQAREKWQEKIHEKAADPPVSLRARMGCGLWRASDKED